MRFRLQSIAMGLVASVCATLPLLAQEPAGGVAPGAPEADDVQVIDVPLPHLSRINGPGALVHRDTQGVEAVAGEHLAFGDRLTTDGAQVQVIWSDGSLVGLDRNSALAALAPDLLALTAGRALVVSARQTNAALRLDTPAGSVLIAAATEVRVSLEAATVDLQVVHGSAEVRHAARTQVVTAGQQWTLRDGFAPGAPVAFNTAAFDTFVEWAREPVVALERSPSRVYLADPRLEAYADVFDRHGEWQQDATYGQVWFPVVGQNWRPFSQGYWQPFGGAYGPTWVGLDPWGWPTHHYGAWDMNGGGRWFWRPGRRWSPGHVTWSVGPGFVGWSPLGARGHSRWAWGALASPPRATQRGVYPGGTLDPFRAWTVIPTERFGTRGGLSPYAVDARTLHNLNAFVTQRVAPPLRYGSGPGRGVGPGGYPGRATGRVGYGPTRVDPPVPGPYGPGPSAAPDNPYERAEEMMVPRGRQRSPASTDTPRTPQPRRQPPAEAPEAATRPTPPPTPPPTPSREQPRRQGATAAPAREAPPSRGLAAPRRGPSASGPQSAPPRRAVPRPPD